MKGLLTKALHLYRRTKPTTMIVLPIYRFGNLIYYKFKIPVLKQLLFVLYMILDNIFVKVICQCEFPARCKIGKGLWLPHGTNGIILHGDSVIGNNVVLHHQVTLGMRKFGEEKAFQAPRIGDDVIIGTGAKILGDITIGDKSIIGANAVVINDVPNDSTAVGVPARVIQPKAIRRPAWNS